MPGCGTGCVLDMVILSLARRKIGSNNRLGQRLLIYLASSHERRVAAATASAMSCARPSGPLRTCRAAKVVPLGDVTLSRKAAGDALGRASSSTAPDTVGRASFMAKSGASPALTPAAARHSAK